MHETAPFLSFDQFLRHWAKARPDTPAFEQDGRITTYCQLEENSRRLAAIFAAQGLAKGDRIAWLGKNADGYFQLLYAAARVGLVMAPIGWRLAPPEMDYILGDSGARLLVAGEGFEDVARRLGEGRGVRVLTIAELGRLIAATPPLAEIDAAGPEDAALQLYTSGTTGNPKGAVLAARSLFGLRGPAIEADAPWADVPPHERLLVCMPCAHIGGTGMALIALANGVTALVQAEFSPEGVLDAIAAGATRFFIVPAALQMLIQHPRAAATDFSRLRFVMYGAAPIPLELLREAVRTMPSTGFQQCYGMTETSGTTVVLPPVDHDLAGSERLRSCGKACPGAEAKIVGPDGEELPRGAIGELWTRSPANMLHYWNLPEATANALHDGWMKTGDAAQMDEDGYIYLQDRIKDMIISGGENVYPAEVESAIYGHPAVAEAAVIGVPDEKWGEAVKAVVVAKPGQTVDADSVIAWARERIAGFKVPKSVDVIAELPRNPSGKILRRHLREPYWEGRDRRVN